MGNNIVGDAANEPSMVIDPNDPTRIIVGWRHFPSINSNFREAGVSRSLDGGRTWSGAEVIDQGVFRTDPVLDADFDGNFCYYSLLGPALRSCQMFKSTDGGFTWDGPIPARGGDKNWMIVDRSDGIGDGNVYCNWNYQFTCCSSGDFTRSTDEGLTYINPVLTPNRPKWGTLAVAPSGEVYAVGVNPGNLGIFYFNRSSNARDPDQTPGFQLTRQVNVGGALGFRQSPNPAGLLGQVWVAAPHPHGPNPEDVYILAPVNPSGSDPMDIMFIRSADGGLTWTAPIRVNDDPTGANAWQWFATLSVAPDGRLDAVWNDTRNTGAAGRSETFYAFSIDRGESWSMNIPISIEWNSLIGWPRQNKIGDYYHMISDVAAANLAYAATFNGEQDIYFVRIGDCNENGIHDGDDIASGRSSDTNGNGIPDECEGICVRDPDWQCDGDVDGDGQVNPVDSGLVQAAFGSTDGVDLCQYDLDCDGQVNPVDSGIVQSLFGNCMEPREVCP